MTVSGVFPQPFPKRHPVLVFVCGIAPVTNERPTVRTVTAFQFSRNEIAERTYLNTLNRPRALLSIIGITTLALTAITAIGLPAAADNTASSATVPVVESTAATVVPSLPSDPDPNDGVTSLRFPTIERMGLVCRSRSTRRGAALPLTAMVFPTVSG